MTSAERSSAALSKNSMGTWQDCCGPASGQPVRSLPSLVFGGTVRSMLEMAAEHILHMQKRSVR